MRFVSITLAVLCSCVGCGPSASQPEPRTGDESPATPVAAQPTASQEQTPSATLERAEQLYTEQLGASGRDDRYTDHQIARLREAIVLYEQFIERAGDDPAFAAAVERSRERIEDAKLTIEFLMAAPDAKP